MSTIIKVGLADKVDCNCTTFIDDKKYRLYSLPEIDNKNCWLVFCQAKAVAEDLNNNCNQLNETEKHAFILDSRGYRSTLYIKNLSEPYYMFEDNSQLIWVDWFQEYGYIYPTDTIPILKLKGDTEGTELLET